MLSGAWGYIRSTLSGTYRGALNGAYNYAFSARKVSDEKKKEVEKEEKKIKGMGTAEMNSLLNDSDALGGFDQELATFIDTLNKTHERLLEQKILIAGFKSRDEHVKQARMSETGELTLAAQLIEYLKGLFTKATSTPDANLQREIEKTSPEIEAWSKKIIKLNADLAAAKDAEEIKRLKLELCNEHLHIVEELIAMINSMQTDLSINEGEIKGISVGAAASFRAIIFIATGVVYSSDFGIESFLRQHAYETVAQDREKVTAELSKIEDLITQDLTKLGIESPKENETETVGSKATPSENSEIPKIKISKIHTSLAEELARKNAQRQKDTQATEQTFTTRNVM